MYNESEKVAIIIVHFGIVSITNRCIESISLSFLPSLDIFLVNNDPGKRIKFIKDDKIIVITTSENNGYASACNLGIKKATEKGFSHFIICNNDVEFTDKFFTQFIPLVLSIDDPIIAAPKINYLQNRNKIWFAGGKINKLKMESVHLTESNNNEMLETEFITGCCFYISDKTFSLIGPLDDEFFLYEEDLDYSIRAVQKDIKLLVDHSTTIYHSVSTSVKKNGIGKYRSEIYLHKLRSKILILSKYSSFPLSVFTWIFVVYKALKYIIILSLRGDFHYVLKLFRKFIKINY